MDIGTRIKKARTDANESVKSLALALRIAPQTLYLWEAGEVKNMRLINALNLIRRYRLEFEWLVTGGGIMYLSECKDGLDMRCLSSCIGAVDTWLDSQRKIMNNDDKAELVACLYEKYSRGRREFGKSSMVRYLRRVK